MRYHPEVKARGLARYKARKTAALDWYNTNIVAIWNAYGRPMQSEECRWKMRGVWDAYVGMLRSAGRSYDDDLLLAELFANETLASANTAFGLTGAELSSMGLA